MSVGGAHVTDKPINNERHTQPDKDEERHTYPHTHTNTNTHTHKYTHTHKHKHLLIGTHITRSIHNKDEVKRKRWVNPPLDDGRNLPKFQVVF